MSESEDKLIPPPANPSQPPKWLADLITDAGKKSADWMKVPGQIMQGVTPETPGQWSETDQMRQDSLDSKPYSWGPQTAFSEVFWPRLGTNVGGSGFNVGSGATGGEGNIIPFPKQGGQQSAPKSTMDMLRGLFSSEKPAEGPSASVTPFTPALAAKQQGAKQQAAIAEQYRNPAAEEIVDPKVAASKEMAKQNWGPREVTPEVQAEKDLQSQGFWFTKPDVNPQSKNLRQDFFVPESARATHPFNFEMETNPHTGNTLVRTNIVDKDRTLAVDIPFGSRQEALDGVKGLFGGEKPPSFLDMFKYAFQQKQNMGVKLGKDVLDLPSQTSQTAVGHNSLIDRVYQSIANRPEPIAVPKDIVGAMGKLDNLGFDRAGQAVGALREDMKTMGIDAMKKKWDIQPQDAIPFQKILNHLRGTMK